MRRLFVGCSLSLLSLLVALPAWAVHSRERLSRLVIFQESAEVHAESPAGNVVDTKDLVDKGTINWDIDPGETLSLRIADPNPLLFTYKWKESEKTETFNAKQIDTFAKSIGDL